MIDGIHSISEMMIDHEGQKLTPSIVGTRLLSTSRTNILPTFVRSSLPKESVTSKTHVSIAAFSSSNLPVMRMFTPVYGFPALH